MFAFISHLFCRSQGPTFWLNLPDQMKICRSGPTDWQFRQACPQQILKLNLCVQCFYNQLLIETYNCDQPSSRIMSLFVLIQSGKGLCAIWNSGPWHEDSGPVFTKHFLQSKIDFACHWKWISIVVDRQKWKSMSVKIDFRLQNRFVNTGPGVEISAISIWNTDF